MASALLVLGVSLKRFKSYDRTDAETQQQSGDASTSGIDSKLILGSAIFGIGWGLSGICPGPAIVGLSSGLAGSYVFVAAMFAGFFIFQFLHNKR
jgi:uncharacterized membrane protein YedE/YeeE